MSPQILLPALPASQSQLVVAVPAHASQWVQLGEKTVGRNTDRDIVYVGSDEGRYEALRFRVLGNRVAFAEARVVYGNGTSESLDRQGARRPGETTQAYDLAGPAPHHQPHS